MSKRKTRATPRSTRRDRTNPAQQDLPQRIAQMLLESLLRQADQPQDLVGLVVERAPAPIAPALLADVQPVDARTRDGLVALYETCLQTYRASLRPQDEQLGLDDAGAALAFFVAANLHALHGVDVTPELLHRLERQLIALARMTSSWDSVGVAQRQAYFEKMAILGTLVAGMAERAKTHGEAELDLVRGVARSHLRQLLALDPDLVTLDATGLALRAAPAGAHAAAA
jgi:hypothetical protein